MAAYSWWYSFLNNRGIGLCIRPNRVAITNNTGRTVYGEVACDNTHFVTWTIVASNNGNSFEVLRDGVSVMSGTSGSNVESVLDRPADGVYICSAPNAVSGSWLFDYVAYKAGADAAWVPVPPDQELKGDVVDANTPATKIVGAKVRLDNGMETTTNAAGAYSFAGLAPKQSTLT